MRQVLITLSKSEKSCTSAVHLGHRHDIEKKTITKKSALSTSLKKYQWHVPQNFMIDIQQDTPTQFLKLLSIQSNMNEFNK